MRRILSLLVLIAGFITALSVQAATLWKIDHPRSRLGFVATWQESEFQGVFQKFHAQILFDEKNLEKSRFEVEVDVTSADTRSPDRDEAMARPEWFFYSRFPAAHFTTRSIRRLENNRYLAEGELLLKGITHPLALPFIWQQSGDTARMKGETVIQRTDFRIGEGEWSSGEMIGLDVKLTVELHLTR